MAVLSKRGKVWYIDGYLAGKRYRKTGGRLKELAIITLRVIQNSRSKIKESMLPEEEVPIHNLMPFPDRGKISESLSKDLDRKLQIWRLSN